MDSFTLTEMLSLIGLFQSLYVLVYMLFRSGSVRNMLVPSLYFLGLSLAFLFDAAAARWEGAWHGYDLLRWFFWLSGVPLGSLLVFQLASVPRPPSVRAFSLLALLPLAFAPRLFGADMQFLYLSGLVAGALSLLAIWSRRELLDGVYKDVRFGRERFWLIISLIVINTVFLASVLAVVSEHILPAQWELIRTILGIAFVYIAGTGLFRIYPQALSVKKPSMAGGAALSPDEAEKEILAALARLLEEQKIYQEASFGRAELARELNVGEANLSRLVNQYYRKTIPQLLNELRVRDASRLLRETGVPVQQIFEESGFNSITTFNRVFKEITGETPKEYRQRAGR
ncbi:MAG: helix-turn-helix transcriptional regulator [Micavibrio sp.]